MSPRRTWVAAAALLPAIGTTLFIGSAVYAHSTLRNFVQHQIELTVSRTDVDVTVELVFNEGCSQRERARMDADGDGRVTSQETAAYLEARADDIAKGLRLSVDGNALEPMPLFDPKIDLRGYDGIAAHTHAVTLYLFARLTEPLNKPVTIELTDRLWPELDALRSVEVSGKGEVRVKTLAAKESGVWWVKATPARSAK